MGFPIKKRLAAQAAAATSSSSASPSDASGSGANASGLDLLSTLAASQHSTVHPRTVSEASLSVSSAASYAASTPKRARTFGRIFYNVSNAALVGCRSLLVSVVKRYYTYDTSI